MEFSLTSEQQRLRAEIVAFARAELNEGVEERDREGSFPRDLWRRCGELQLQGLSVPAEYGGRGLDALSTACALEALGYGCVDGGLTFSICAHLLACVVPVWRHGTEDQKRRYLPELARGTLVAANAMTEPGSGSDAFAMSMVARTDGNGFRLNGTKIFVSNGPTADLILTYAVTDREKRYHGGITGFIVPRETPGVRVGQVFDKLGLRTSALGEIVFEQVYVPPEGILGRVGGGGAIFAESMDWERTCLVAAHVGAMERLIDHLLTHARATHRKTVVDAQRLAHTIVDLKVRFEAARLLTYRAAAKLGRSRDAGLHASIAKLFVSEALVAAASETVSVLGPSGLARGDPERMFRDSVASTVYSGTSEIQRDIIARWLGL
jgi:alkylation response protein AidB-like acyl-CoA dehydrogenase